MDFVGSYVNYLSEFSELPGKFFETRGKFHNRLNRCCNKFWIFFLLKQKIYMFQDGLLYSLFGFKIARFRIFHFPLNIYVLSGPLAGLRTFRGTPLNFVEKFPNIPGGSWTFLGSSLNCSLIVSRKVKLPFRFSLNFRESSKNFQGKIWELSRQSLWFSRIASASFRRSTMNCLGELPEFVEEASWTSQESFLSLL